jgi:hypothetical protein
MQEPKGSVGGKGPCRKDTKSEDGKKRIRRDRRKQME